MRRLALLMTTGATRTIPTAGMEVILNIPPIDTFLQGQAMRIWRSLRRSDMICAKGNVTHGHIGWIQSNIRSTPLTSIPPILSDHGPKVNIGQKQYHCTIGSRTEWENNERTVRDAGITCFTDGSLIQHEDELIPPALDAEW